MRNRPFVLLIALMLSLPLFLDDMPSLGATIAAIGAEATEQWALATVFAAILGIAAMYWHRRESDLNA